MRILVTGTRQRLTNEDKQTIKYAMSYHLLDPDTSLVIGDCPTGVDAYVAKLWEAQYKKVERFIADWDTYGKAAGPYRNKAMVDSAPDYYLAFPKGNSKGTYNCVLLANRADIKGEVIKL